MTPTDIPGQDVRVITTLGHVDHGKTTFVDSLLAANNIISVRQAGQIRYMDSREDEQERGITMESSAVSLRFSVVQRDKDETRTRTYLVNLIDTPGHVDFSSEVSAGSRLCDGSIVLVDAVEGVCTQTIAVLRQAWSDLLTPILVINKMDRLITELRLSTSEAYRHLSDLIEQVNAVMGSFFAGERMENNQKWHEERARRLATRGASSSTYNGSKTSDPLNDDDEFQEFQEKDDENLYFAPEKGNVIFASALHGWGFRVSKFAQLFAIKLGIKEANLRRVLWGDFYLDPKTKKILSYKHLKGRSLKPLFVQIVLDNLWAVYESAVLKPEPEKIEKIVSVLNIKVQPRDIKSKDTRHVLSTIFGQWLPLSMATIQAVIDVVPPPVIAQQSRLSRALLQVHSETTSSMQSRLLSDILQCNSADDAHVVAYVSKMFAVSVKALPENQRKVYTAEELRARGRRPLQTQSAEDVGTSRPSSFHGSSNLVEEQDADEENGDILLGFARLFAGVIRVGSQVHCVLPKWQNSEQSQNNSDNVRLVTVQALYVMMGKDLVSVEYVHSGNVFAIRGLEGIVWRNATLCAPHSRSQDLYSSSLEHLINLGGSHQPAAPIVRVALEPASPGDLPKLIRGLQLLAQSDPCVETFQQQTGEHVIVTAGELHLERCMRDLRERFARIKIHQSKPIVPFRETAIKAPDMKIPTTPNTARGTITGVIPGSLGSFSLRAVPIPERIVDFLRKNMSLIRRMQHGPSSAHEDSGIDSADRRLETLNSPAVTAGDFWDELEKLCKDIGSDWKSLPQSIWTFGPHGAGTNVLVDSREIENKISLRSKLSGQVRSPTTVSRDMEESIETGFQIATFQGPLCAEPMNGMAFFVERVKVDVELAEKAQKENKMVQITGSLISATRDACRNGLLDWSPRLMLAMYSCEIQASSDVLGKVYGVVSRRKGRIISEEMKEGTSIFGIRALMPVVESFGFADDIRKKTSGAAVPQLVFSGFEILDEDPFWVPATEEELEDLGDKADRANVARLYMDRVRKRKGLFVEKKVIEFAEKQRTLKR